jgi:hypothetical protein
MKEIKKSASFKSKQKGKDVQFNIDLNYSPEYDSFIIKIKEGEGFMSYTSSIERMPLEVIQKLNEMLEEVLIKAGSQTKMLEDLEVELGAEPNPNHSLKSHTGSVKIKTHRVKVKSLSEAQNKVREFIEENDLGSGNFTGGDLFLNGKKIGMVSYNGRLWDLKDEPMKMLFGGDFQSGVYDNGGKVDTKLSISEVDKIAKATANALGSEFSVTKDSVDTGTFDLDYMGEKYDGGSYLIMDNGDVVNVSLQKSEVYYNYKTKKKANLNFEGGYNYEFGGDFQSGVYAKGGSLESHGIKEGDTFIKTILGNIQKVKDKNGNIVFINLANGERSLRPPLPFNRGGSITNERKHVNKGEDYEVRYAKPRPARKGYKGLRSFEGGGDLFEDYQNQPKELAEIVNLYEEKINNGDYDYVDSKKFLKEVNAIGYTFDYGLDNVPYNLRPMGEKSSKFFGGGLFKKSNFTPTKKYPNLNQQQVYLKNGEFVAVLEQNDDELLVMEYSKMGSGERPKKINISEVDMTSFKNGGALIGNQKRIDMNKNKKIDAEDFKLLRSSMNGAWRNERKHVNHNEDYEVRYAKKKPSRTGYKGKRKFGEGGGISNFERLSRVVAKNYEGKRVKPQYQKEYGKVYSKAEAKEVGNKVAGKIKMMKKAESGSEVKKGNRGGIMLLAKKIRKEGESWKDAVKRAGQQSK